jgi:hypothetical protein
MYDLAHLLKLLTFSFIIRFGLKHPQTSCKNGAFLRFSSSGLE